jgi:hypothetical protein
MKNFIILLLLTGSGAAYAQIRAFDNSKAIMPWIYNPAMNFTKDFQAYVGYDGRGNSSFMPQSIVAGFRMPTHHGRRDRHKGPPTMIGVQLMTTSQDIVKSSTLSANFAHQIPFSADVHLAIGMGAGIFNMKYSRDKLVYIDQPDPLLGNGENLFNVHLNAGACLLVKDYLVVSLAAPDLMKDHATNFKEIIFRASYSAQLAQEFKLITSVNLDTYNHSMIVGGDVRAEMKKMFSILAGADSNKFYGGILLDIKPLSFGYTYGQNYSRELNTVASHQLSVFSNIPFMD